jgi:hypothetical protein
VLHQERSEKQMYKLRDCPICGSRADIRIIIAEYGFNGVIIECANCHCNIKDGKCSEQIHGEGVLATPITKRSLSACLFRAIALWNNRSKRANEQDIGEEMPQDIEEWKVRNNREKSFVSC